MAGLQFFVQLYLLWNVLFRSLHLVTGTLKLTANSDYIVSFQPITLNCTSNKNPNDGIVTFYVDNILTVRIKYIKNKCFIEHFKNSTSAGGGECNVECDCQHDGKSYIWSYNGTVYNDVKQFNCSAVFDRLILQQSIDVLRAKSPSGIQTLPNENKFYVNETEGIENISCKAACVPECTYNWTTPDKVETNNVLFIPYAFRNHTGNYTCTAWNTFGNTNIRIEIFVQYRPSINILPNESPYKIKKNDRNVTIRCVTNDAFPIDPIWYTLRGPRELETKSQNYTISSVQEMHSGTYSCTATNAAGVSDVASMTIDVLYGPVIAEMNNVNITEDSSFIKICNVAANPNATRIWWTRSKDLNFYDEGNELIMPNVTRQLSDTFTCNAQNRLVPSIGEPTIVFNNRSFSINVQYGPTIMKIKDVNVTALSDFTSKCIVNSNPEPSRVWWTGTNQEVFIQEGVHLNLPNISKTSSGYFICHAQNFLSPTYPLPGENAKRNTSRMFHINVQYGPLISIIKDVDVIENAIYNVSCNVSANPLAHRVWWSRSKTKDVFNGTNLIFSNITRADSDWFTCHAENVLFPSDTHIELRMTGNRTFKINVQYGPGNSIQIIPSFRHINITENKDIINITCQAECNPPCSYRWTNNSSNFIPSGHLLDTDVHRSDAGNYTCSANTSIQTDISTISLEINVLYAATILELSSLTTVNESFGYILECKVDSFPLSTITWIFNRTNAIVFEESSVRISRYNVKKAKCNATGIYACSAFSGILPRALMYTELHILCSPRYNSDYHSSTSPIGIGDKEPLNITVYFISYPKPKALRWIFYNNKSLEFIEKESNCYKYGLFEHMACFFMPNVTETDFGFYRLQVNYTDFVIWEEEFRVEGNRRPDKPQQVNFSCGIEEVYLNWKAGFDGGEKQTFYILIVTDKASKLRITKYVDIGQETLFAEEIKLPQGVYSFAIFTNNSYGNATSEYSNCTISARKIPVSSSSLVISTAVGSTAGIIVLCLLVAGFLFFRKRVSKNTGKDKDKLQRSCLHNVDDEEEDGLKDNPMYVSSGPKMNEKKSSSDVYSVADKMKGSSVVSQPKIEKDVYSQVVRKNAKGKGKAVKNEKVKDKFIEMDSVYENSNDMKKRPTNDVYANTKEHDLEQKGYPDRRNKDGLIYADLDLAPCPSGKKFVIRGLENRNNYAVIDLTKTAEPLPSDSDSEDVNVQ